MDSKRIAALGAALITLPVAGALAADAPFERPIVVADVLGGKYEFASTLGPERREAYRASLIRAHIHELKVVRRLQGREVTRGQRAAIRRYTVPRLVGELKMLERRERKLRRALRAQSAGGATTVSVAPSSLAAIAACESGGNPRAIGGGGAYRGKYQFSPSTWASVGGSGDPAAASEGEQDKRAAILYARAGASPWPVCGR